VRQPQLTWQMITTSQCCGAPSPWLTGRHVALVIPYCESARVTLVTHTHLAYRTVYGLHHISNCWTSDVASGLVHVATACQSHTLVPSALRKIHGRCIFHVSHTALPCGSRPGAFTRIVSGFSSRLCNDHRRIVLFVHRPGSEGGTSKRMSARVAVEDCL
jgi:hypothetical protein